MKREIRSLDELKNVNETAKFVFDRVIDGKLHWSYGQYSENGDRCYDDDETGIIVDLITGRVFATTYYNAFRNEKEKSIFNITDRIFGILQILDCEKYIAEDVEFAIKKALAQLRDRFSTQVPMYDEWIDNSADLRMKAK